MEHWLVQTYDQFGSQYNRWVTHDVEMAYATADATVENVEHVVSYTVDRVPLMI